VGGSQEVPTRTWRWSQVRSTAKLRKIDWENGSSIYPTSMIQFPNRQRTTSDYARDYRNCGFARLGLLGPFLERRGTGLPWI
jgi:hypothetical protein